MNPSLLSIIITINVYLNVGVVSYGGAHFGAGVGPVHMNYVQCSGSETGLLQCTHSTESSCSHSNDAGVQCPGS